MRRSALTLGAALLCAFPATARADQGEIIVQREPGLSGHERAELRQDAGVELVSTLPIARTELVKPQDGDVRDALTALRGDDEVVSAEPDTRVQATTTVPNDFYWTSLWALSNPNDTDIDAPEAWDRGALGDGVTVAVVDTGINASHDDLAGQTVDGWDFVDDDATPQDGNGHGSHVAGTIAAAGNNNTGLIGVAPDARVMPLRVLDDSGSGWMSDIAAGFEYAADHGVPIVSASLGGSYSSVLEDVIGSHPRTLFVVAAGNENGDDDNPRDAEYPCAFPEANVICVGASNQNDDRASFSNYGATSVDLFAPGVGILSAWKGAPNAYRLLNGTSMATPHVAGAAALALSANPSANSAQLKWALLSSADVKPALSASVTGGRLNADGAVAAVTAATMPTLSVAAPVATPTPTPTASPTPVATATPEATRAARSRARAASPRTRPRLPARSCSRRSRSSRPRSRTSRSPACA